MYTTGLLVDDAMIAEFASRRMLEQNTMGSNADGKRSAEYMDSASSPISRRDWYYLLSYVLPST
jgi:hypothetical protein